MALPATLVLEGEEPFFGRAMGFEGRAGGMAVSSTLSAGFSDLMTDPAYDGKIVCFTYPHVGNAGVVPDDFQSDKVQARAVVAREFSKIRANRLGTETIDEFLKRNHIPAIEGVDTRRITEIVSRRGLIRAIVGCGQYAEAKNLEKELGVGFPMWKPEEPKRGEIYPFNPDAASPLGRIVIYDLGVKRGLLRRLAGLGLEVWVAPADFPAENVLERGVDAVGFSAGPGVPSDWQAAAVAAKTFLGKKPIFSVGVGAGVVAAAAGAEISANGRGHFGAQPVGRTGTAAGEMTCQAHEFWIGKASLAGAGLGMTHFNLNDKSVEGFKCGSRRIIGVLFNPEAQPGPQDSLYIFDRLAENIREWKGL